VLPQRVKLGYQQISVALWLQELQQHRLLQHELYDLNGVDNLCGLLVHQRAQRVKCHLREYHELQHQLPQEPH
jgi:hypothetical protein